MNRRDFFKTSAAAALVPSFPVSAGQLDLEMWIEENFTCKAGLAGPWVSEKVKDDEAYSYKTIAIGMTGDDEAQIKPILVDNMIKWLQPMAVGKPELWWRKKPMFLEDIKVEYGDVWMSLDDYADLPSNKAAFDRMQAKGQIPSGIDVLENGSVKIPDNVKLDLMTEQYRYVQKEIKAYMLRMRIAIPSKDQELSMVATPEGAKIRMIT